MTIRPPLTSGVELCLHMVLGGDGGYWGSNNGDDGYVTGTSSASADAAISISAFNQEIVMGANLQQNAVDMTVVGGNLSNTVIGEDDDA